MQKIVIALSTMLLSVLIIVFSIEAVTARGVLDGMCTFYQTISPSGKYFYIQNNINPFFESAKVFLFIIGNFLLYIPNFMLFDKSKIKSIILMIVNTIGLTIEFILFKSYSHMFMLIVLCVLIAINIFIQFTDTIKSKTNMLVVILTSFILIGNIYYLFAHFMQRSLWEMWEVEDNLINEMLHYSRINIICLALWFIPYTILLIKDIITTHKSSRTVN